MDGGVPGNIGMYRVGAAFGLSVDITASMAGAAAADDLFFEG